MGEGEVSHVESCRGDVMWCAEKKKTVSNRGGKADKPSRRQKNKNNALQGMVYICKNI